MTGPVVDVHAHAVPPDLLASLARGRVRFPGVRVERSGDAYTVAYTVAFGDGAPTRPIGPGLTDGARRQAWMAERGVDVQVLGGWLDVFGYELPAAEGADWARLLTEEIRTAATGGQIPLATVPLQDPDGAAEALREAVRSGCPGVMVATRVGERELDEPAFTPFWEAADELRAVVYLHPGFGAASRRYADYGLVNALARLEDSTVTMARLLYAGVPARYPGMRMVVAHGGGALPYVLGRLARGHAIADRPYDDPVESFARLYFDSVVFDPVALEVLVAKAGPDRVLLGSDYPFPIGDPSPREVVERARLDEAGRARVLGGTATRLFGLDQAGRRP